MRWWIGLAVIVLFLLASILIYPRPDPRVSPAALVSQALRTPQGPAVPMDDIQRRLASGCTPILEGSDTIDGAPVWAVRLKIPPPRKYPWLELWIDKKDSSIVAWKQWGRRDGRVQILSQYSPKH